LPRQSRYFAVESRIEKGYGVANSLTTRGASFPNGAILGFDTVNDSVIPNPGIRESAYAAMQVRVAGTNINATTLLATDYLNHFNEIIMLFDLVPDAPECIEDCRAWRNTGYAEHFAQSSIADSALAAEAYGHSPAKYREPFDAAIEEMTVLAQSAIGQMGLAVEAEDDERVRQIAEDTSKALRTLVDMASAIIHGETNTLQQSQIDEILGIG